MATVAPRDLLLLEWLDPQPSDLALEIGTGSGSTLMRLAGLVRELHGADISSAPLARLERFLARSRGPARRVQLFAHDFCLPDAPARIPHRYDLILSCDTLEHVPDPAAFFANVHGLLRPRGRAFITFPNEHPRHAHGITWFSTRWKLEAVLRSAGFEPDRIQIDAVEMNPKARRVQNMLWRRPRRFVKQWAARRRGSGPGKSSPQTFDQTDFFKAAGRLEPIAPLVNAYCWGVMQLMKRCGPVYRLLPAPESIWDTQLLIRARRSEKP